MVPSSIKAIRYIIIWYVGFCIKAFSYGIRLSQVPVANAIVYSGKDKMLRAIVRNHTAETIMQHHNLRNVQPLNLLYSGTGF